MANQGDMRVGDADRDAAATRLREHFAAGRLTLEEFQDRLRAVFAATTRQELGRVTADLPHDGVSPGFGARAWAGGGQRRPTHPRAARNLRTRHRLRSRVLLACAAVVAVWLLIGFALPHNGLLIAALVLMLGMAGVVIGVVAGLIWLARRAWRQGAWLDGLPLLVGMPWLGRVLWAGRAIWMGRAVWRAGNRFRPASPSSHEYRQYQASAWPGSQR
jgi:DUF1707 SHOCT-like domain